MKDVREETPVTSNYMKNMFKGRKRIKNIKKGKKKTEKKG